MTTIKKILINLTNISGSVALNPLAGKIMFRDFVYITYDYSVRIQDGYFIFRWWRSYVPKDVSEGKKGKKQYIKYLIILFVLNDLNRFVTFGYQIVSAIKRV